MDAVLQSHGGHVPGLRRVTATRAEAGPGLCTGSPPGAAENAGAKVSWRKGCWNPGRKAWWTHRPGEPAVPAGDLGHPWKEAQAPGPGRGSQPSKQGAVHEACLLGGLCSRGNISSRLEDPRDLGRYPSPAAPTADRMPHLERTEKGWGTHLGSTVSGTNF